MDTNLPKKTCIKGKITQTTNASYHSSHRNDLFSIIVKHHENKIERERKIILQSGHGWILPAQLPVGWLKKGQNERG